MNTEPESLRYEIKNVKPVVTEAYGAALVAVASEFEQFMCLHVSKSEAAACQMEMASVENGSLISDLAPHLAGTLPLLGNVKHVVDFTKYLSALFNWAQSKTNRPAIADEKKTLKNISNIVRPTVHDNGAQMNIGTITGGTFNVHINLSEPEARGVLGFAKARLDEMSEVKQGQLHESVVFYWDQANRKLNSKSGDKGKIDSIASHAVNVRFSDESIKRQMALDGDNPFKCAYLVNVYAQTAYGGKVVLYTIDQLLDVIDIDPAA